MHAIFLYVFSTDFKCVYLWSILKLKNKEISKCHFHMNFSCYIFIENTEMHKEENKNLSPSLSLSPPHAHTAEC